MKEFCLNLGNWNAIFAVPCAVVDRHIKMAGSAQLKVLLWVLRHAGEECSVEAIASALGFAAADVCDAMQYWIEAGLVSSREGRLEPGLAPAEIPPAGAPVAEPAVQAAEKDAPAAKPLRDKPRQLSQAEIAARINGADEIKFLADTAELVFGRPLSTPELGRLIDCHDWYGLPVDVLIMAIQYAQSIHKCNMNYIEKMAANWAEQEIVTHERAERRIRELDARRDAWNQVVECLGMERRPPSEAEGAAAERWITQWKFPAEMIQEAYNRCVDSTGKIRISYMNKIMERWHAEGILTLQEAKAEKTKKSAQAGEKEARSKDLDELEQRMMQEII